MNDDLTICLEALDQAITFEDEGMRFFKTREASAPSAMERSVFRSLAADEAGHKAYLIKMREELATGGDVEALKNDEHETRNTAREIFAAALESVEDTDPHQADELEILRGALEVERKGYKMYSDAAAKVTSARAKEIFEHLAQEEISHFQLLTNTLNYLSDPEGFNSFTEGPMLDGG